MDRCEAGYTKYAILKEINDLNLNDFYSAVIKEIRASKYQKTHSVRKLTGDRRRRKSEILYYIKD